MMTCTTRFRRSGNEGFTLLEILTVAAIFAMLVGIGVPLSELYLNSKLVDATREEMAAISGAAEEYYLDLEEIPDSLVDLVEPANPPVGWMGPYLPANFNDERMENDDYRFDSWRSAYVYEVVSTSVRRLSSFGPNRQDEDGDGDDIVLEIDFGPAFATATRRELETINSAITRYNDDFVLSTPLSTDYATLLGELQAAGYLPADAESTLRYLSDAWGQPYQTNGQTPVVQAFSVGTP